MDVERRVAATASTGRLGDDVQPNRATRVVRECLSLDYDSVRPSKSYPRVYNSDKDFYKSEEVQIRDDMHIQQYVHTLQVELDTVRRTVDSDTW